MAPVPPVAPNGHHGLASLVDWLRLRARQQAKQRAFTFLGDGEGDGVEITYGELDQRARALGGWFQSLGLGGQRALLLYPPGLEFLTAFFGCLYGGVVAVPAYPPRPNRPAPRLGAVATDAEAAAVFTTTAIAADAGRWLGDLPALQSLTWIETDQPGHSAESWSDRTPDPSGTAFLQYTSGSTSSPRGVEVTHANLVHNSERIRRCFQTGPESRGVFWLPLYHDMGLIGGVIQTIYCGGTSTLLSPASFLQRPLRWLEAISRTRATISGGPDFAYDLCIRKITPEQRAGLDLSSWTLAFDGAEPIRPETLRRFVEFFGPCGFRTQAFYPCYGLAESTLIVSGGKAAEPPVTVAFQGAELDRGVVVECSDLDPDRRVIMGCGQTAGDQSIVIADPERLLACPAGRVGEIWVSSPSVARGYWGRAEETQRTFQARLSDTGAGPYLRTGDLGFIKDGELFVTGRIKDLIVIRGRNHYPHDIEWTVERSHASLRPSSGAAFSVEVDGQEQLVIVQEVERHQRNRDTAGIIAEVRRAVASHHELELHAVVLLKPGSIPKTSSGKIQRHACREAFLAGGLEELARWTSSPAESAPATDVPDPNPKTVTPPAVAPSAETIRDWLVVRLAERLGIAPADFDVHAPFVSFGMSSAQAVALSGELEDWLGRRLSPTLIYNYPTTQSLARHLAGCDTRASPGLRRPAHDDDVRARLLAEVEGTTDEESSLLIAQEFAKYLG